MANKKTNKLSSQRAWEQFTVSEGNARMSNKTKQKQNRPAPAAAVVEPWAFKLFIRGLWATVHLEQFSHTQEERRKKISFFLSGRGAN